jgi:1-acyl-sn-glycerol-3-phosphate acyltransferase
MNTEECMQIMATPSKPRSEEINPEITRLPVLTLLAQVFRRAGARVLLRILVADMRAGSGSWPREYAYAKGPLLIVSNHLGDADVLVGHGSYPASGGYCGQV